MGYANLGIIPAISERSNGAGCGEKQIRRDSSVSTTAPTASTGATRATDDLRKTVNRLRRAQGQLVAVIAAVESDAGCRDVVTQLAAVSSAIDRAGFTIISSAMNQCLAEPNEETRPQTVAELEKLFLTLA